jgi:hypothetical protein
MNYPLKRRKFKVESLGGSSMIRSPAHLKFVRGFCCSVAVKHGDSCGGKIEAAHVRIGTDGGTSLKPSDCWALPLCSVHHAEQHRIGERSFETKYSINMKSLAEKLWKASKHRLAFEKKSA